MDQVNRIYEAINQIMNIEESPNPNFHAIKAIADQTIDFMQENNLYEDLDKYVLKFLEDYDIRRIDARYGEGQRRALRKIVGHHLSRAKFRGHDT